MANDHYHFPFSKCYPSPSLAPLHYRLSDAAVVPFPPVNMLGLPDLCVWTSPTISWGQSSGLTILRDLADDVGGGSRSSKRESCSAMGGGGETGS
ncbi:hypothetical protein JTE90_007120 [Oedothorax gibbosus]|uniref:Uncharacterized protein n=1 Tax=Oedothorax gibbosus TaxID=931172 RepID=A0AAV6VQ24_9ARAC|nr:hypothetical protein JTE90_007120 [Oedothorax gibbosus]